MGLGRNEQYDCLVALFVQHSLIHRHEQVAVCLVCLVAARCDRSGEVSQGRTLHLQLEATALIVVEAAVFLITARKSIVSLIETHI